MSRDLWYAAAAMTSPLCPECGCTLKALRGMSDASLSCAQCGWRSDQDQKGGTDTTFLRQIPSGELARGVFGKLLDVSRPRKLSWNWPMKGAVLLPVLMGFLGIWAVTMYLSKQNPRDPIAALIVLGWATAVIAFPMWPELLNRKLLREGELAVGCVVHEETFSGRRDSWTVIFYAFADGARRGFIGKGRDFSDSLGPGAPVIIYYDALNPQKNVALECSRLSVKVL